MRDSGDKPSASAETALIEEESISEGVGVVIDPTFGGLANALVTKSAGPISFTVKREVAIRRNRIVAYFYR